MYVGDGHQLPFLPRKKVHIPGIGIRASSNERDESQGA